MPTWGMSIGFGRKIGWMDPDIRVSHEQGIVRVAIEGELDLAGSSRAIALATGAAAEAGSGLLLFDITRVVYPEYHAMVVEQARRAQETGIIKFRIAILGTIGDPMLAFMENVAINRGIRAKAFTSESDAVAWLRAERAGERK